MPLEKTFKETIYIKKPEKLTYLGKRCSGHDMQDNDTFSPDFDKGYGEFDPSYLGSGFSNWLEENCFNKDEKGYLFMGSNKVLFKIRPEVIYDGYHPSVWWKNANRGDTLRYQWIVNIFSQPKESDITLELDSILRKLGFVTQDEFNPKNMVSK